jgi:hypothetical protein
MLYQLRSANISKPDSKKMNDDPYSGLINLIVDQAKLPEKSKSY